MTSSYGTRGCWSSDKRGDSEKTLAQAGFDGSARFSVERSGSGGQRFANLTGDERIAHGCRRQMGGIGTGGQKRLRIVGS
ncbi:MAG TPA: hypothetical protein DCM07_32775, partial [Planctomycetaceae bacterium]|nr:hypothetical protein [Planctomycetaceae bacterium]